MRLIKRDAIERKSMVSLGIKEGDVLEVEEIKEFAKLLEGDAGLYAWWRVGMGYVKDGD
jgi:hypothetical protein